ncbi:hypothetical protein CGCSCA4_v010158 [Colletotrichum siamense]|uniref:Transmembrane protein n=1 Tax=Colletotrichum siamense TaxID=690259 RepID=A0A9P5ENI3_COLSI|nr:hypothetical protein CGCSCA4_v010158 [Colletotrichum siamense]KAF4855437.1 hypothetical protein CGCSCA2_v009099 [Colletotrichum siamense]
MPPVDHHWEHYMMFPTVRKAVVQRAAGLVSFAETANPAAVATADSTIALSTNTTKLFPVSSSARRKIPRLYSYTNGTVVDSAIVPIFEVNSFEWVKDIRTLPGNITKALKNSSSNYLTISENRSPLTQVIAGTSALLKDSQWTRKPADKLPDHRVYKGTKFAAIYVSRNWNQGENENYTCPHTSIDFGDVPLEIDLLNIPWNNNFSDCLAVAKLEITAGVTQCSQSDLSKSPRSTCLWAFNVLSTDNDNDTVSPDPLVSEVFAMMPEIQSLVVAISSYEPGILQGNLERFLRNSLVQAYQGGWSAMAEYLSPVETQRTTTSAWKPVILLEARVSSQRMYIWMGMGMTLVASGLLLMIIQATCKAKTVNNSLVAAVMLDSSEVARRDATGLCNAVDIGKGHGNAKLRLRLKVSDTSQSFTSIGSSYTHPRLVPDAI